VLWPDTYVLEANVPNLVAEIRTALGDSARTPRYVRTAPGTGYAFDEIAVEYPVVLNAVVQGRTVCKLVGKEQSFRLAEGVHLIGRGEQCDLMVPDSTVSRRHAKVTVCGTTVVIEDLGSRNGTFVRGLRLSTPVRLADGDDLCIGAVALSFRVLDPNLHTDVMPVAARQAGPGRAHATHRFGKSPR
jgi:pSer/pThr/pTyr-binding forkhead associated (FHA) protein